MRKSRGIVMIAMQQTEQQPKQSRRLGGFTGKGFMPGTSGNPRGVSRAELRFREFVGEFERIHSREPNKIEIVSLRNAAALASRIIGNKIPIEEQVRAGNLLARLIEKLGLDRTPAPAAPKTPNQTLEEACALIREGQR